MFFHLVGFFPPFFINLNLLIENGSNLHILIIRASPGMKEWQSIHLPRQKTQETDLILGRKDSGVGMATHSSLLGKFHD